MTESARCPECQSIIDSMRAKGYQYTARQQDNGPWEVAFLGARGRRRATSATLHNAIHGAGGDFRAAEREVETWAR